jgi:hypothetical protein
MDWSGGQPVPQAEVLRGDEMRTPDEVAAMLRLKALGWGIKRIARELGCSHMTVRRYVAAGRYVPYRRPVGRPRALAGLEAGWPNASADTAGMPMWCARSFWPRRALA